ncbi:MAG: hypothetical protein KC731_25485 [Myxococcales bacterium]|nr:hypothetical protein [Myxococcales bacterium]
MKKLSPWLLLVSLVGCDALQGLGQKPDEDAAETAEVGSGKKGKSSAKDGKKSGKGLVDTVEPDAPKGGPASSCGPPNQIPVIPGTTSPPPSLAEWSTACDVNTQGAGSQPGNCTMKIVREWLQVTCRGDMRGYESFEGFGSEGADYFKQVKVGNLISFVVRLGRGKSQKVRLCTNVDRASLFVSWPPSRPQPSIVALGVGPRCDFSGGFKVR